MLYKYLNSKKGFTLTELLAVVLILGVLLAIAVPIFDTGLKKQKEDDCRNQCLVIETAVKQAMYGMIDNGKKQEKITFKCSKIEGDEYDHTVTAQEVLFGQTDSRIEGRFFKLTDDPDTCFTLAQVRGGFRPGTKAAFMSQNLDSYKEGCKNGFYLKKIKYQLDNDGKGTPFYVFLDNQEVPVCPFEESNKTNQPYFYYVLEDGTVKCTCQLNPDR